MLDFTVTFAITIINITILFLFLRKVLFKPVTKFMEDRANRVQETMVNAQNEKNEAKKLLALYEEKLQKADDQADSILQTARKNAESEAAMIVDEGKAAAEAFIAAARSQIEAERQAALARFKIEAAALVMAASGRLVQREFSGDDQRRYADMLLEELAMRKGN